MDVKYYITKYDDGIGLFVTSRTDYWQERCRLRISPSLGEEIAHLKDVKGQTVVLGFDQIDSKVFNGVVEEVSTLNTIKELAIHNSKIHVDFTATLSIDHLYIGEKVALDLHASQIESKEVTFLNLKTFKGRVLSKFPATESLTVWYDRDNINKLIESFYNVQKLVVTHCNVEMLDLGLLSRLTVINLAYCRNLTKINVLEKHSLEIITVQTSKKYVPSIDLQSYVRII